MTSQRRSLFQNGQQEACQLDNSKMTKFVYVPKCSY